MYTRISDKVVGILLRAKKYGLLYFEPEMLFQVKFFFMSHFILLLKCIFGKEQNYLSRLCGHCFSRMRVEIHECYSE